jgi:hypothetical protein
VVDHQRNYETCMVDAATTVVDAADSPDEKVAEVAATVMGADAPRLR